MTTTAGAVAPSRRTRGHVASAGDVAVYVGAECLRDGPVGKVGLEIEAHCFDLADPLRRPGWDELTDVIANGAGTAGRQRDHRRTGWCGRALRSALRRRPGRHRRDGHADRTVLRQAFAQQGLGLVLLGADPLRPAQRVNPGARYRAMEQFFAASDTGAAGAAMMTSTASVQVNVDAGPRDQWADAGASCPCAGPDDDRDLGELPAARR